MFTCDILSYPNILLKIDFIFFLAVFYYAIMFPILPIFYWTKYSFIILSIVKYYILNVVQVIDWDVTIFLFRPPYLRWYMYQKYRFLHRFD